MGKDISRSTGPRIPLVDRTNWQADHHYKYGAKNHTHDVDMFIEHKSGEIAGLVEFKNPGEPIELYKYGQFVNLANKAEIPAYICVGFEESKSYYIIPLNDLCKKIPTMSKPRVLSEVSYIKFLHYIKKMNAPAELLVGKNNKVPSNLPLPNVR